MRIELLFLGKTKAPYLAEGIADYRKRLQHYVPAEVRVLKENRAQKGEPDSILIEKDSETLENSARGSCLVCLDRSGRQLDSEELSVQLEHWHMQGQKKVTFVIGGHLGLSPAILDRADLVLSLSLLTFTHEMTRLLLVEQLYRAYTIRAGEKYHK